MVEHSVEIQPLWFPQEEWFMAEDCGREKREWVEVRQVSSVSRAGKIGLAMGFFPTVAG
jgi:hypothetical protein